MTMKERLEIHRQIEAENERKLKEWKRDKLIDMWENSQGHDGFYEEKIALLQDVYAESLMVVQDLEKMKE